MTASDGFLSSTSQCTVVILRRPFVTITAPTNNAAFAAGTLITNIATAYDLDGFVTNLVFYNGNTPIGTATSAVMRVFGCVDWWPGEGNANDVVGTNNGTLMNGVGFAPGEVGQAFVFNGSSTYMRVPASSSLDVGQGSGFTIEAWVNPVDTNHQVVDLAEWNNNAGACGVSLMLSVGAFGDLFASVTDTTGANHNIDSAGGLISPNSFQHLVLTYDKTAGMAVLYRNGMTVTNQNLGSFTPQTSYGLYFGERPSGPFQGKLFQWNDG